MNKITTMLVAFFMVATMFAPAVSAQNIDLTASVSATGNAPVINYQFALSQNETDNSIIPGDDLEPHSDTMTQIMPIAGDGMTESLKTFRKYVVVSDPNGISDIAAVYEQLRNDTEVAMTAEVTATDITGNVAEWTEAINQAYAMNLITEAAKDDMLYGLAASKAQYRIFRVYNTLTNHDKPGLYNVYFKVVDNGGAFLENTVAPGYLQVEYMSLKAFETDFATVNYGSVIINSRKVISGDEVWEPENQVNKPTIKNQGNVNIQMNASASDLLGTVAPVQSIPASALSIHMVGYDIASLSNSPQTLLNALVPCTPEQVDFDITAPYGTSANTYTGTIILEMV
jgi:hypothetical protein